MYYFSLMLAAALVTFSFSTESKTVVNPSEEVNYLLSLQSDFKAEEHAGVLALFGASTDSCDIMWKRLQNEVIAETLKFSNIYNNAYDVDCSTIPDDNRYFLEVDIHYFPRNENGILEMAQLRTVLSKIDFYNRPVKLHEVNNFAIPVRILLAEQHNYYSTYVYRSPVYWVVGKNYDSVKELRAKFKRALSSDSSTKLMKLIDQYYGSAIQQEFKDKMIEANGIEIEAGPSISLLPIGGTSSQIGLLYLERKSCSGYGECFKK